MSGIESLFVAVKLGTPSGVCCLSRAWVYMVCVRYSFSREKAVVRRTALEAAATPYRLGVLCIGFRSSWQTGSPHLNTPLSAPIWMDNLCMHLSRRQVFSYCASSRVAATFDVPPSTFQKMATEVDTSNFVELPCTTH